MSVLRRILGREPLTDAERKTQDAFRREESAAVFWEENYDRDGESMDNTAHVGNHELWLEAIDKYGVTRQGMINGYVRAYCRPPYWLTEHDHIGE